MLDVAAFLASLTALPVESHQAGAVILRKGHTTGRLYILKQGAVEVVDGDRRIAQSNAPGAVFGELGVLLDQPHMEDVRVVEPSDFYVAHGTVFLRVHREAALHVAGVLARRLVAVHADLDAVRDRGAGAPPDRALEEMVDAVDRSLHGLR
jgi:CRP/FNR family transcriptional regulator, cyclic AMP receptor protein